jgi:hypothetical protein
MKDDRGPRTQVHHAVNRGTLNHTHASIRSWCRYASNIGVLLANKAILSNYHYKYPIFLTLLHMLACTFYSLLFIKVLKLVPYQPISSRTQMLKISGLSLIFCLSVVAGNVSLRFLPVSFNQAIGATGPFFTALFAVLMTWKTEAMTVSLSSPIREDSLGRSRTFLSGAKPWALAL